MILRIDHVAIAVRDYEGAVDFIENLFGAEQGVGASVSGMNYHWQLFSVGDLSRMEILTPTGDGSFLDNFLDEREGGVHHITLQTDDIEKTRKHLDELGIPYFGFNNYGEIWKELFIHPKDNFGVLFQISEFRPDDWLPDSVKMNSPEGFSVRKTETGCRLTIRHEGGGTASINLDRKQADKLISDLKKSLNEE